MALKHENIMGMYHGNIPGDGYAIIHVSLLKIRLVIYIMRYSITSNCKGSSMNRSNAFL